MPGPVAGKNGKHIVPSPEEVATFVHSTALSIKQLLADTRMHWGPVEWAEYHTAIRAKLALTPDDAQLTQFCHDIQLAWNAARQREMQAERGL